MSSKGTFTKEFKKEFKNQMNRYKLNITLSDINWSLVLIQIALILQGILLIVEFMKYPDIDYNRIYVIQLFIISTKLSWLLIKK